MIPTKCAICGSFGNFHVIYEKNFSEKDFNKDIFSARRIPDGSHYQMVKCQKDGLVRSNPILEPQIIARLYKDSRFTYEEEVENLKKTYFEVLNPVLQKISKKDAVLEIGCGNGFILKKLYEMGYKNCFGVEPSKEAVEKADKERSKNIIVDVLRPGIFKSKKFKFIFFFQTLDHVPNPDIFLKECYRLLEEGGYVLAFNHNVESISAKILGKKSAIIDIEHIFLFSPETIRKLFKKNNLRPLKVFSPFNTISLRHLIWLLPIPLYLKKILQIISPRNLNFRLQLGNLCIIAKK